MPDLAPATAADSARLSRWTGNGSLAGVLIVAGCLVIVAAVGWISASPSLELKVATLLVNVVLVVGLQTFSGNSGILSFAHMAFAAIGAYVSSILTLDPFAKAQLTGLPGGLETVQLGFVPAALIAMAVAGAIALLVGLPVLRLNGPSAVIAIFALLLIANVVLTAWTGVTQGAGGLYAVPRYTTVGFALGFALIAVTAARFFRDSSLGLQLRASREDALSAASVGVRVLRARLLAWVLSAMICAAGGVLFAHLLTAFTPSAFYLSQTFVVVVMLVVGGMNTVGGAVLGTIVVTIVQEGLRPVENAGLTVGPIAVERLTGLTQAAYVVMILAVMYFRPEGLLGQDEPDVRIRRALARLRRTRRIRSTGEAS